MSESEMAHGTLEFGLLGAFEASRDSAALSVGGRRQRAILAMLVCEAGNAVSVERLIDGVWGDPAPSGVVTSVQSYIFHLRQVLEPERSRRSAPTVLVTVPGGYRLAVDRRSVDATRFEEVVASGDAALEQGNPERAATHYGQALSLWRGDVLADLSDHPFVAPVRARLEEERASALESRVQAELDLGRNEVVVAELGALIAEHPLRERFHAQRILALYRSGRQSDALAAYRELRSVLDTELGIEPSPPLQELNNQVLRQDPALDWTPPAIPLQTAGAVARPSTEPVSALAAPHTGSPRRRLAAIGVAVAALAGGAALPVAGAPPASAEVLPNAVSELDASGSVVASVPIGTNPIALASAGGAVWVVNAGDDTVYKVNPSTHSVEQVVPVGHDPRALAVTGDDVWVTNFDDGTVSRINVDIGQVVMKIDVGGGPDAIAAGPAGLWVANSNDNTIQRIDPRSGTPRDPIDVGDGPDGLAVDETSVWVANGRDGTVLHIDATSGDAMSSPIRVGSGPRGIVRTGDDVWVADELSQSVTRIPVAMGPAETYAVGDGPTALAVLGGSVWVAEKYSGDLLRIDLNRRARTHIDIHAAAQGLAVVDGHLWVTSGAFASTSHLGGTLRTAAAALPGDFGSIDPSRLDDIWSVQAVRVVYDGLLAYHYSSAEPQVLVPDLATSVPEPTDRGRTYTFNLRPGILYSTGAEVRASDLVLGVRRALDPQAPGHHFYWGIVGGKDCTHHWPSCDLREGVDADDATGRVTFHLAAPDPEFLWKLTLRVVPTPPGTPVGKLTSPLPGTGPYRIASYHHHQELTLTRNPFFQHWSAAAQPAGFVDSITWAKVASAQEAVEAVQQGRADLAEMGGGGLREVGSLIDDLLVTAPSHLHRSPTQSTGYALLNSAVPPFDNLMARRAFNYALDRTEVVKLSGGPSLILPTCQLMPPTMPSYGRYCPYTIGPRNGDYRGPDLAKARALVRASGTLGMKVIVTDVVDDFYGDGSLEPYYAKVLRSIGYRASVRRLPDNPANRHFFYDPRSGIQVESGFWAADYPLPSNFYALYACATSNVVAPTNYCDRDLDRRATEANRKLQTDPGAAMRAWSRIDRALTDHAPLVPLTNLVNWWITSERVGNYRSGTDSTGPLLSQMWVQ